MSYNISSLPLFDKQAKRLARKYPSLKNDLAKLLDRLSETPDHGKALGSGFFKIRISISSKGKGKSSGARIITYLKVTSTTVYLVSIYDKSEQSTITDKELEQIFKLIP